MTGEFRSWGQGAQSPNSNTPNIQGQAVDGEQIATQNIWLYSPLGPVTMGNKNTIPPESSASIVTAAHKRDMRCAPAAPKKLGCVGSELGGVQTHDA